MEGSITRLIEQITSGDASAQETAAAAIWQRYCERLLAIARQQLHPRLRQREDENDVLQDMFKSFCVRAREGQFKLTGRDSLWNLLVAMTVHKARHVFARHTRAKRNVGREQPAHIEKKGQTAGTFIKDLQSLEPGPEDAAQLAEGLEQRLETLGDARLVQIALWKLEGDSNRDIAAKLNCVERTVERKLELIRRKWA